MGRYIDPDKRMTDEDKEFLHGRARSDEVIENERRFPPDAEPADHEPEGFMPKKEGYDYKKQAEKTEDATGLPIDQIPVDAEGNPVVPEYGYSEDDDDAEDDESDGDLDDDILNKVLDMTVEQLKDELRDRNQHVSGNKDELIDRLANVLQDERDAANAPNDDPEQTPADPAVEDTTVKE